MTISELSSDEEFYSGQFLIAMPGMSDPRFVRSVIYLCAHSKEGAMGIIVNQCADNIKFDELLGQLNILSDIKLKDNLSIPALDIHVGGPAEPGRGFVLHSSDYHANDGTLSIDGQISLTATLEILKAIAEGRGPNQSLLALGYAGWSPGQLEGEIQANGWLTCPATSELIFDPEHDRKYDRVLASIGIDSGNLVADAGHS